MFWLALSAAVTICRNLTARQRVGEYSSRLVADPADPSALVAPYASAPYCSRVPSADLAPPLPGIVKLTSCPSLIAFMAGPRAASSAASLDAKGPATLPWWSTPHPPSWDHLVSRACHRQSPKSLYKRQAGISKLVPSILFVALDVPMVFSSIVNLAAFMARVSFSVLQLRRSGCESYQSRIEYCGMIVPARLT
jgi:hypothetical protein